MNKKVLTILIVGSGIWGQKYISTLKSDSEFGIFNVMVANRYNWRNLIDQFPDYVIIATPPNSHIEIASYSLSKNIPTLIEKPLALSLSEINILSKFDPKLILVNHIHLFSQPYQRIKELIKGQKINKIISNGFNKGPFRDYSGLWDYAPHDISMILDLANKMPESVQTVENKMESGSLFTIRMNFKNFFSYSIVGNGGEIKVRNLTVKYHNGNILDKNVTTLNDIPPLNLVLDAFLSGKMDISGFEFSKKVMVILDACQKSVGLNNKHNDNATIYLK